MKFLKKAFSALLVLIMMLGIFPVDMIPEASAFNVYTDVNRHWAAASINRWNSLGFLDPYFFPGSDFQPDKHITRIEFFSLIIRSLGATALNGTTTFTDVANLPEHEQNTVAIANHMGIAYGLPDGTMRPHSTLLRQDAATLITRALGMSSAADWILARFTDDIFISEYARAHVTSLVERGALSGYPDGSFRPNGFMTRAEAVKFLDYLFNNV